MWELDTRVSEIVMRTPSIKSFRFETRNQEMSYIAGQFFFVTIMIDGEKSTKHFSFSSSPTEKGYVEFTKRITSSDYSRALDAMKPGAWAHISGPAGKFTLSPDHIRLGFLSGGIGITPLRSMLRYIADEHLSYDVVLIYANNSVDDIAFRNELDVISTSRAGIRVEYILSGSDVPPEWTGGRGFITETTIRELVPDFLERVFYISGPFKMVTTLSEKLSSIGVPREQVRLDYFPGYNEPL